MGNSAKPPYLCLPRLYEINSKLLDIEDRIEQSAVLLEQSSLEDNSDNDEIPDLG